MLDVYDTHGHKLIFISYIFLQDIFSKERKILFLNYFYDYKAEISLQLPPVLSNFLSSGH